MKDTEWIKGLYGKKRIYNNKIEFVHNCSNKVLLFNSNEELEEYLQEYHIHQCELSVNS